MIHPLINYIILIRQQRWVHALTSLGLATLAVLILFYGVLTPVVWAGAISVDSLADTQANDGQCTLREAIINANNNDQSGSTDCAPGTNADLISFSGSGTILLASTLPTVTEEITLDGAGQTVIIDGQERVRVLRVITGNITVRDLTIQRSIGGGIYAAQALTLTNVNIFSNTSFNGGGVYAGGVAMISHSRFENNLANDNGGGLYVAGTSVNLIDTIFINNTALDYGGGVYATGSVTVSNGRFENNLAKYYNGGGLHVGHFASILLVTDTVFISNTAQLDGGGLYAYVAKVKDSHFENNQGRNGGGLYVYNNLALTHTLFISNTGGNGGGGNVQGTATVSDSRFEHNQANIDGGGLNVEYLLTLFGTIFISNTAGNAGGGLEASSLSLTHTLFISNTAGNGGGVSAANTTTISDSYFENNRATSIAGGGLLANGALTLTNTIFISNTARYYGGGIEAKSATTISNSRFENNQAIGGSDAAGGGLRGSGGSLSAITNTLFINNTAGATGGGVYTGPSVISQSRFENNQVIRGSGGGLVATILILTNTSFISNTSQSHGGGVFAGTSTISGSRFENNQANGNYSQGGGLYASSLTLLDTAFVGNTAQGDGGGVSAGPIKVNGSQFENNQTNDDGGGLYTNSTLAATNTIFLSNGAQNNGGGVYIGGGLLNSVEINDNYASNGGGLYLKKGTLSQASGVVTLTHNSAIANGGGIYVAGGTLTLNNTHILSNTAATGGAIYQANGATNLTGSCIVFNSNTAVNYAGGTSPLVAMGNWWGAANGPSGLGPGDGDSISSNVEFSNFLTGNLPGCPNRPPIIRFTISGRVTDNNLPLSGVTIFADNGLTTTTTTDGYYTFTNLISDDYILTPTLSGYTFSPVIRIISVPPNSFDQNFTATLLPPISPSNLIATAISQTQINLAWISNSSEQTNFRLERSLDGNIGWVEIATITADMTNYDDTGLICNTTYFYRVRAYRQSDEQFSNYSNTTNATTFTCPNLTYTISGRATSGSTNLTGVVIRASNGFTATTNASGDYTLTNLITGTYILTPSLGDYIFSPVTRTVNVPPSQTGQDFNGTQVGPPQQKVYLPIVIK